MKKLRNERMNEWMKKLRNKWITLMNELMNKKNDGSKEEMSKKNKEMNQ